MRSSPCTPTFSPSLRSPDDLALLHSVPHLCLPTFDDHALSTTPQTTASYYIALDSVDGWTDPRHRWLHYRHPGCHRTNHSGRAVQSTNLVLNTSVYREASGVAGSTDTSHTVC
ncbi:hypothetical protein VTO73DRAFT_6989 [Trametes versicolor]